MRFLTPLAILILLVGALPGHSHSEGVSAVPGLPVVPWWECPPAPPFSDHPDRSTFSDSFRCVGMDGSLSAQGPEEPDREALGQKQTGSNSNDSGPNSVKPGDKSDGKKAENPLFVRLVEEGIAVDTKGKVRARLPKPTLPDGLSQADQEQVLVKVAGHRPLEEFVRNVVVAPFAMEIVDLALPDTPEPLRRVDVGYVAYGRMETLFSEEFLEQLLHQAGGPRKSRYPVGRQILSSQELTRRNLLLPPDAPAQKERYLFTAVALFDRVLLRTTRQVIVTKGEESLVLAAALCPAFDEDAEYPNQWQPIEMDEQGRWRLGPPHPYRVSASYTKVTRLQKPEGALFIEHHHLFAEPNDWFGGKNFLRSKLPLAVQEAVRKLRWELRSYSQSSSQP